MQNKGSLQNKFEGFGKTPAFSVWQEIEASLPPQKKKRAIILWWTFGSIAAMLVFLFGYKNLPLTQQKNLLKTTKELITVNNENSLQKDNKTLNTPNESSQNNNNQIATIQTNLTLKYSMRQKTKKKTITKRLHHSKITKQTNGNQYFTPIIDTDKSINETKSLILNFKQTIHKISIKNKPLTTLISSAKLSKHYEISTNNVNRNKYTLTVRMQTNYGKSVQSNSIISNNNDLANSWPENFTTANYNTSKRPFTLRLGIIKHFNSKLFLQSGLDFGLIKIKYYNNQPEPTSQVSIYTLGVPIKLGVNWINNSTHNLFSTLGLVNEIPILNKITNSNQSYSGTTANKGFLGGSELDFGYGYKLTKAIKFDLITGIKYYYTQKVTNYNASLNQKLFGILKVGLSINI